MLQFYFHLQFKRLCRHIEETGIPIPVGLLALPILFVGLGQLIYAKVPQPAWAAVLIGSVLLVQFSGKKRLEYLHHLVDKSSALKIRLIENAVLALPFFITLLIARDEWHALLFIPLVLLFSLWKGGSMWQGYVPTPFGKIPQEPIQNFRKLWWLYPMLYFVFWQAIGAENANLAIAVFFAGLLIPALSFAKPEEEYFVWMHSKNPAGFLWHKAFLASLASSLFMLPIFGALLWFFPSHFATSFLALVGGISVLFAVVFAKYSCYPRELGMLESVVLGLGFWLPPVMLVCAIFFFLKAKQNLKYLLHD